MTTGMVEFDRDRCTLCGICARCCPVGSIVVPTTRGEVPHVASGGPDIYLCFACGNCVAACPHHAATLKRRYTTHTYYNRLCRAPEMTYPRRY
ncbi:MAG: 4Fe-4S binding protein [Candidatus Riflebacteria bacterium]|nr:4Fe-4S binding protein [Candidatus Riflebacteria bacterium]